MAFQAQNEIAITIFLTKVMKSDSKIIVKMHAFFYKNIA